MKKIFVLFLLPVLVFVFSRKSHADSPITATDFYEAYLDVKMVERAHLEGVMGLEIAEFLTSPENPIDVKAAVINGLSWRFEGKNNAELYAYYLALLYHLSITELDTAFLSADEIFCLGYLTVMDDYFHPEYAIQLLEEAHEKNKDSFTVSIILAIAKAQRAFSSEVSDPWDVELNWCESWKLVEEVLQNKELTQDLRHKAVKMIVDYMILYKEYCR